MYFLLIWLVFAFSYGRDHAHISREGNTPHLQKVNVRAVILGNATIGFLFLEDKLTGNLYPDMLDGNTDSHITHEPENQIDAHGYLLWHFQQDSAPPYYFRPVQQCLSERFQDRFGRSGANEWPPRSPQ